MAYLLVVWFRLFGEGRVLSSMERVVPEAGAVHFAGGPLYSSVVLKRRFNNVGERGEHSLKQFDMYAIPVSTPCMFSNTFIIIQRATQLRYI